MMGSGPGDVYSKELQEDEDGPQKHGADRHGGDSGELKAYERPQGLDPVEGPDGFGSASFYPGDIYPEKMEPAGIAADEGFTRETQGQQPVMTNMPKPWGSEVARDFRKDDYEADEEMRPVTEPPASESGR